MREVLKKVEELVDVLTLRIRSYEEARATAMQERQEAAAAKQTQEGLTANLTERVRAVEARESRVQQIESLQELKRQVTDARNALALVKEQFVQEQAVALRQLKADQDAVVSARAKIVARETQLDEDRKTYKTKAMQELIGAGWKGPEGT